jgi:glycosyltransferase involved in cell wall biosynthesis
MRILVVATDLYYAKGGGQTVYRRIIEETPDCQFHYFLNLESAGASRPPSARAIPLQARRRVRLTSSSTAISRLRLHAFESANQIARSVAGQSFDIVDIPDFENFGAALRTAFAHHGVRAGKLVLALHGSCSTSREMNWGTDESPATRLSLQEERTLEGEQFAAADAVYGISPRYIRDWQQRQPRPIRFIDPLHFLPRKIGVSEPSAIFTRPSVYCVGRAERRKGNDIFVELVRWLRRDSYAIAAHIGDQDWSHFEKGSSQILDEMAARRGIEISHRDSLSWEQLHALYQTNSILILPVRYDTLNLVALEALFSGCPVAISSKAGVCDYLDAFHPDIPYVKIDLDNIYSAVGPIQDLIDHFPEHRHRLHLALTNATVPAPGSLGMAGIYQEILDEQAGNQDRISPAGEAFPSGYVEGPYYLAGSVVETARRMLAQCVSARSYAFVRIAWLAPRQVAVGFLGRFGTVRLLHALREAARVPRRLRLVSQLVNTPDASATNCLATIYDQCRSPLFRCNYYLLIAGLERSVGHELMAVAYELRILRLVGSDRFQVLPRLVESLQGLGLQREADAARSIYADSGAAEQAVRQYLVDARESHRNLKNRPFEVLDDRRTRPAKVAVIVSLYRAASKLTLFLSALVDQSLVKQESVEIILIDSGSPDVERKVVETFLAINALNLVYARSAERETIQAAWNRGIGLATAPYLVFLGVDETLYPEALEILADELDHNPDVDWVMANSLVTAVNDRGLLERDVMTYDRTGARKEHTYLETCYLSWVGGMYRRNIHERFGYYDETFTAAGDTEFKSRVLPGLKVKFIPRMLGLFLNYPDERTTASPRAEIEDLRAWYIHRTPAGIRYAFEQRPIEDAQWLLGTALGYRKSFCGHISSDIDYAAHLADYLVRNRNAEAWVGQIASGLHALLQKLRQLEFAEESPSVLQTTMQLAATKRGAKSTQAKHAALVESMGFSPRYGIHNDNRYEQHSWLWKS